MKLEMHVHTRYSHDSILRLSVLYLVCKIKGISCIAITDHNTIKGAMKFKQRYGGELGGRIQVVVGEEIMTTRGEVIGLFLKEEIPAGMTPDDTITEIIRQGGLVYVPHPYDVKRHKTVMAYEDIERNKDRIDFIECHNGRNIAEEYGIKQNSIAEQLSISKVVGSDAHTMIEIGRNYMEIPDLLDLSNKVGLKEAISRAAFKKQRCLKISHQITKAARLIKFIIRGDFNGLLGVVNKKIRG